MRIKYLGGRLILVVLIVAAGISLVTSLMYQYASTRAAQDRALDALIEEVAVQTQTIAPSAWQLDDEAMLKIMGSSSHNEYVMCREVVYQGVDKVVQWVPQGACPRDLQNIRMDVIYDSDIIADLYVYYDPVRLNKKIAKIEQTPIILFFLSNFMLVGVMYLILQFTVFHPMGKLVSRAQAWDVKDKETALPSRRYHEDVVADMAQLVKYLQHDIRLYQNFTVLQKKWLEALFDSMPDCVFFKDRKGRWIWANQVCIDMFGLKRVEPNSSYKNDLAELAPIVSQPAVDVFTKTDAVLWAAQEKNCTEKRIVTPSGKSYMLDVRKIPIFDDTDTMIGIMVLARDITEQRSMLTSLGRTKSELELILGSAGEGILGLDRVGAITFANPAACDILGQSVSDLLGRNFANIFEGLADVATFLSELSYDPALDQDLRLVGQVACSRSGGSKSIEGVGRPLVIQNDVIGAVVVFRDVTEQLRAEKKLRTAYADLRDTQSMLVQTEKMAAIGRLVAGIAHEVNTPIGVGLTGATLVQEVVEEIKSKLDGNNLKKSELLSLLEKAHETSALVQTNIARAAELVQSFKKVSVDQTNDQCQTINLHSYVNEILLSLRPNTKKRKVQIHLDCPDSLNLVTYPGSISQIITNLVMNSLIHGFPNDEEGQIHIVANTEKNDVVLEYFDTGCGIPENIQARIFEPFFTTLRGRGGSGVGLNIVYTLVTQTLKGDILLDSHFKNGTKFVIRLPLDVQAML